MGDLRWTEALTSKPVCLVVFSLVLWQPRLLENKAVNRLRSRLGLVFSAEQPVLSGQAFK